MKEKSRQNRPPLTDGELERITANDFLRLKLTDDEMLRLRAINQKKREEISERTKRLRIEQDPIINDLKDVGFEVESVWDFLSAKTAYQAAIPVLLRHLTLPYSDRIKEGIARSLAVPDPKVKENWPMLVKEYRNAAMGQGVIARGETKEYHLGTKDGLACVLAVAVTDQTLPELIALAEDRTQGESRILLLSALRDSKNPIAKQAIERLRNDPQLSKEISSWRK
ncbi:hypothetical protein [Nitrospirillum viridazoti]|uniref:hypothetical protein n=1 Tax=Nitrospirillum viridazoti TaxID=3144925 RepID=UPI0011A06D57|nr:hypothetical protein [Nitrospirillum amazonense]TWB26807.1 hypothetical protein FBZ91_1366 [Nitrospirillum amazonense]